MSFTLKCDKCKKEIKLKTGQIYDDTKIKIDIGPVGDEGALIECRNCDNTIEINRY